MTNDQNLHRIHLSPPFYSDGTYSGLHRYLDAEFITRFQQDIRTRRFDQPQFTAWLEEETHSQHDSKPVLRLPAHRTFHIVCCEAACEQTGRPALCPQRVTSAGFVIRRVGGSGEMAWMMEDGEPLGWQEAPSELRDPDIYRRLCASGILHKRTDEPAYSGEQVHPLHVLPTEDENGKFRTLLYGFVPLGGFYFVRDTTAAIDSQSFNKAAKVSGEQLPWPFGYRKPLSRKWRNRHARPVDGGRPRKSMYELIWMLVNRYHLGENNMPKNSTLETQAKQLWFFNERAMPGDLRRIPYSDATRRQFARYRRTTFWSYLRSCADRGEKNPLAAWIARQEKTISEKGGLEQVSELERLPAVNGRGHLSDSLYMSPADAQNLRNLLGQRYRDQTLGKVREIPLPKFSQGRSDVYQIVPFVRFLNDDGKEQIQWADRKSRSLFFRVAAPFDPEASRPSLIQMPSLADLKRGLAKGVSMLTPEDTFNTIQAIDLKKGASVDALPEDEPEPGPSLGIQWICSFSLPVITLVAMILLMIMISLLNIIFFWMPWVRICLPFPKIKE